MKKSNIQIKFQKSPLRYASCWEDAEVLLKALNIQANDSILSIGSGGDNTFSILSKSPKHVVCIDANPVQLFLIELKKAAFHALDHQEFLQFLGFRKSTKRIELFEKLKPMLTKECANYWLANIQCIKHGVIYSGKFEKYLRLFSNKVLPLIHRKPEVLGLLSKKDSRRQLQFYQERWNNRRWRFLFKLFFSQWLMGLLGRDPSFFKEVKVPVGQSLFLRAENYLSSVLCQRNEYLNYILTGSFGELLPHYARKENFESIKQNLQKLHLKNKFITEIESEQAFNKFNLSNVFEYLDQTEFEKHIKKLNQVSKPNAILVYWNLFVSRNISTNDSRYLDINQNSCNLETADKCFFYEHLRINQFNND